MCTQFSKPSPDTTVTAGAGINKNSVSSSITRQPSRQQRSSLCARQHIHVEHMREHTRVFSHTFAASHLLHPVLQRQQMERSTTQYNKCCWTWPVSNQRSRDRCNMFTKQTSNTHVRGGKSMTWSCTTCEKKPGIQAGISLRGFEGISERWEDCVPHQDCKSVSQNSSYVSHPRHPRQFWLLAEAVQGHRHWWAVFKPLSFLITFHFRAVGKLSRITISQKSHLDPSG